MSGAVFETYSSRDGAISVRALRRYFEVIVPANFAWEFAHMPLYTIWHEGTAGEFIFAAVHCTGGDILIAMSTLVLALLLAGSDWPDDRNAIRKVALIAVPAGVAYTIFSEWLNIVIRAAWAYSDLMPVVPIIDAGLSPLLQWTVISLAAFWWAAHPFRTGE